jgi:hypothetical protein
VNSHSHSRFHTFALRICLISLRIEFAALSFHSFRAFYSMMAHIRTSAVSHDDVEVEYVGETSVHEAECCCCLSHPVLRSKLNAFFYVCHDQFSHIKR